MRTGLGLGNLALLLFMWTKFARLSTTRCSTPRPDGSSAGRADGLLSVLLAERTVCCQFCWQSGRSAISSAGRADGLLSVLLAERTVCCQFCWQSGRSAVSSAGRADGLLSVLLAERTVCCQFCWQSGRARCLQVRSCQPFAGNSSTHRSPLESSPR